MRQISLIEFYNDLPEYEKQLVSGAYHKIKEVKKAEYVVSMLPEKVQKYYSAQYAHKTYRGPCFVGLSCRSCEHWIEFGHKEWCPLNDILPDFDWKKFHETFVKPLVENDD